MMPIMIMSDSSRIYKKIQDKHLYKLYKQLASIL